MSTLKCSELRLSHFFRVFFLSLFLQLLKVYLFLELMVDKSLSGQRHVSAAESEDFFENHFLSKVVERCVTS